MRVRVRERETVFAFVGECARESLEEVSVCMCVCVCVCVYVCVYVCVKKRDHDV